jgi:choline dehydrogenase-like flavoprotein
MRQTHDVVVIGSGFGGAITAARLAWAGRSVAILSPRWSERVKRRTLDPYYDRVQGELESKQLAPPAGRALPPRTEAFLRAARQAGYEPGGGRDACRSRLGRRQARDRRCG